MEAQKNGMSPWLAWLSGVSSGLWTERSLVRFLVRAHAMVAGRVPRWGCERGNQSRCLSHIDVSLSPVFSLFSPLSKKKKRKARWCASSMVTQQVVLLYHTAFQAQNFQWLNLVLFFQFYQAIIDTSHCTSARYIT